MLDRFEDLVPPPAEQRRALAALWVLGVVGSASFVAYDATTPTDLPVGLVAVVLVALVAATVALRGA